MDLSENAEDERAWRVLDRTIPEQFVDYHENHLFDDLDLFNQKLADWLVDCNAIRPHKGLGLKTPVQAVIENNKKCNMGWTHTRCGVYKLRYLWRSDAEGEPCNTSISDTEQRLCRIACLGQLWEMTSKHAQERLKILGLFNQHGTAADL